MGQWYGLGRKETIFGSNDVDGNADFSSLVYKKIKEKQTFQESHTSENTGLDWIADTDGVNPLA